jgi:hypothetical protein
MQIAFAEMRVIGFWAFYVALLAVAGVVALSISEQVGWSGRFAP